MSDLTEEKQNEEQESGNADAVSAYLQTPRKKRRNHVVIALSPSIRRDIAVGIERFIKKNYPQLVITHPRDPQELTWQFNRNISLLLMNDDFVELDAVLELVKVLKTKRSNETIPVLFLTQNPDKLVREYHKKLAAFNEADDFCDFTRLELPHILGRVKVAIDNKNRRRTRRYRVNLPIRFFHLTKNAYFSGTAIDLTIHGILIESDEIDQFHVGDQLRIHIPVGRYLDPQYGEFIKLSAKVRRVFISGIEAGASFEYVDDYQSRLLTEFVTKYASELFVRTQRLVG